MKSKVTISDIAAIVGVSKTTVSRYINGKENMMSEDVRNRIKSAIEMYDYMPNEYARNLKNKQITQVGVVIADISSPFSSAVMTGIMEYLSPKGYTPIFIHCNDSYEKELLYTRSLLTKSVAGLIVNTTSSNNTYIAQLARQGFPIVLCDRYINNYQFNIVASMQSQAIHAMVEHLKSVGYTRPFFFIQDWETNPSRLSRRNAFINAVEEVYGYNPQEDIILVNREGGILELDCIRKLHSSLKADEIPVIIGGNSITTLRAFQAAQQLGLQIPNEIGICGPEYWDWHHELSWPTLTTPNITTFYVHTQELGRCSAELLLEVIRNPNAEPRTVLLPCELKLRESTNRHPLIQEKHDQ